MVDEDNMPVLEAINSELMALSATDHGLEQRFGAFSDFGVQTEILAAALDTLSYSVLRRLRGFDWKPWALRVLHGVIIRRLELDRFIREWDFAEESKRKAILEQATKKKESDGAKDGK